MRHLVDFICVTVKRELEGRQCIPFLLEGGDTLVGHHEGAVLAVCTNADELRAACELAHVEGDDSLYGLKVAFLEDLA